MIVMKKSRGGNRFLKYNVPPQKNRKGRKASYQRKEQIDSKRKQINEIQSSQFPTLTVRGTGSRQILMVYRGSIPCISNTGYLKLPMILEVSKQVDRKGREGYYLSPATISPLPLLLATYARGFLSFAYSLETSTFFGDPSRTRYTRKPNVSRELGFHYNPA